MEIGAANIFGDFQSEPDPRDRADKGHRVTIHAVTLHWTWRTDGDDPWRPELLFIPNRTRWDGASRPDFVGWVVPRFGVFSLASLVHDVCFETRPFLSNGLRISRKHTDALFFAIMEKLALERVGGWKYRPQLRLAKVMHKAVRLFGETTWDRHDEEFPTRPPVAGA